MRAFIATYYNEEQARIAVDEYVAAVKDKEVMRELEVVAISPRWRVGVIIDNRQTEFDFESSSSL